MSSFYQKLSKHGKPIVNDQGLPVFKKSINHRLESIKNILTISMPPNEAKWWRIQHDINQRALIGFKTH